MLRAILLGLLAVTAGACSHHDDAPVIQVGAPAGDVVEVTGVVTATGASGARTLKQGDTVAADEAIDTGTGRVAIVLKHNGARWELGPDHHGAKVAESAAWRLAKVDAIAKPIDEQSTPAGREAEHHAVDTVASTTTPRTGKGEPPPPVTPPAEAQAHAVAAMPPPPPAPPPPVQPKPAGSGRGDRLAGDDAIGATEQGTSHNEKKGARRVADPRARITSDHELAACLPAAAHVTIACTVGTCRVTSKDLAEPVRACLVARLNAMSLGEASLTLDLAK